jgi:hypothetical protein
MLTPHEMIYLAMKSGVISMGLVYAVKLLLSLGSGGAFF